MKKVRDNITGFLTLQKLSFKVSLLLFLVFIGFIFLYFNNDSEDVAVEAKTEKENKTFALGSSVDHDEKIAVSGILEPVDSASLVAKVSGNITSFPVVAGDILKKGDLIAEIEHSKLDAELAVARAEYARMKAEYDKQVALREASRTQAQTGVKKADLSSSSSKDTTIDALEYAYKGAYDLARQSLADAITDLVALSDQRNLWKNKGESVDMTHASDAQIKTARILLGADGRSALWDSGYLVKLDGGVRGVLETMDRNSIDKSVFDSALEELTSSLLSVKNGLKYLRSTVILRGSKNEVATIDAFITQTNNALSRITGAEKVISSARILADTSAKKEELAKIQANQVLDDSIRLYETAETSAKRSVDSAKQKVVYAETRREDAFVRAPFNGVISDKFISIGESVTPGVAVVSVASDGGWKAVFSAADVFNEMLVEGAEVRISINGVSGVFVAPITRIIPTVESSSRRIRFEVELPNLPNAVRSGMVVDAEVSAQSLPKEDRQKTIKQKNTFSVPNKFIGYDYDGAYVFTEDKIRIPVTIFSRQPGRSIILGEALSADIIIQTPLY